MQSYFLDKQDIIKVTGDRFYRRGLDYVNKGRVQGLSFTPSINQWKAVVRGTENYPVRIFSLRTMIWMGSAAVQPITPIIHASTLRQS